MLNLRGSIGLGLAQGVCFASLAIQCLGGGVEVTGNHALLPDEDGNLAAYALQGGSQAALVWTHTDVGDAQRIVAQGRYAYVAGDEEGMNLVDLTLSGPFTNLARAWHSTDGACPDLTVSGDLAFLADSETGVVIVDAGDFGWPAADSVRLQRVSTIQHAGVHGLDVLNNMLYVATEEDGLHIYDISDPQNPLEAGELGTFSPARLVQVEGVHAFVVTGDSGIEIIDVSNPLLPERLGTYTTSGRIADLDLSDAHLFLANTNGQLEVVSASNPADPLLEDAYPVPGGAYGVDVVGNQAFVRDGASRLVIVDLAAFSPMPPRFILPPADTLGVRGRPAVMWADAEGTPPLVYQWYKDGVPVTNSGRIEGADGPLLSLLNLVAADAGAYSLLVSNAYGAVVGSNALLSVVAPGFPAIESLISAGGSVGGIAMADGQAFVAAGEAGLHVIDAEPAAYPTWEATLDTDGSASAVALLGDYSVVADGTAGIKIVDVTASSGLALTGQLDTAGTALGVDAVGGVLYVADGEAGLQVACLDDLAQPTLLGGYDTPGTAYAVRIVDDLAYVADGESGLQILNVANRSTPFLVGSIDTAGTARDVQIVGHYAYVADGTAGLLVINISNPAAPYLMDTYATAGPVNGLVVVQNMALLAEGPAGIEVVNLAYPTKVLPIAANRDVGDARGLAIEGTLIGVACGPGGVRFLSLAGLVASAPEITSIPEDQFVLPGSTVEFQAEAIGVAPLRYQWFRDGEALFECETVEGVASDTLQISNCQLGEKVYSVRVVNAWNLRDEASVTLHVVPVGTPVGRAVYADGTDMLHTRVVGQRAYVASHSGGLQVLDVTFPLIPSLLGSHPTLGLAQQVDVRGHLVYVAAWDAGLEIFDAAVPDNLVRIGHLALPGLARGVHVSGSLAYIANQEGGLQLVDVGDPTLPFFVAQAVTDGPAIGVWVQSNEAYVASSAAGLEVFDVSDPLGVRRLSALDTPGEAENVMVVDGYAFVADYDGGLQIVDVSDPNAPVWTASVPARGDVYDANVVNHQVYMAEGTAGINVLDAVDPAHAGDVLPGFCGNSVHGAQVQGRHAFLADRSGGFAVAELLGIPPAGPELTEFPSATKVAQGSDLVLSVGVTGTPPFLYQWFRDGVPLQADGRIAGVLGPHLRVTDFALSDTGAYSAVVISLYGSAASPAADVTTDETEAPLAPVFVTHPVDQTSPSGGTAMFDASVAGSAPMAFRWHLDGQPVFDGPHYAGAGTTNLAVLDVGLTQAGGYFLKAYNEQGLATSQVAMLTFTGPVQTEINAAVPGSTIYLAEGLSQEALVITKDIELIGMGPGETILDGLNKATPITISNAVGVTLRNVTVRNGLSPAAGVGGGIRNHGDLLLDACRLVDNQAYKGGALVNFGTARLEGCTINSNRAAQAGGGVYNVAGAHIEITDSTVAENTAILGGGVFSAGTCLVTNSTVAGNLALGDFDGGGGEGGGIFSETGACVIVNSTVSGNRAQVPPLTPAGGMGGGVFAAGGSLEFLFVTAASNTASRLAGGIGCASNTAAVARNTMFAGNADGAGSSDFNGTLDSAGFNLLQSTNGAALTGDTTGNLLGLDPNLEPLAYRGGATRTHALRSGSPAIDSGVCDMPATDQRGIPRPFDIPTASDTAGGCDIGAFEYVSLPPLLTLPSDAMLDEDAIEEVPFDADDGETPDGLIFTIVSGDAGLLPYAGILAEGAATNKLIVLRPGTNMYGSTTVYVHVADSDGFTNAGQFGVTVLPVNDAPGVVGISNLVGAVESTEYEVRFSVYDVDDPAESITIGQVDSSNPALVDPAGITSAGTGETRVLTLPHPAEQSGVTMISFVTSDGAASVTNSFLVSVPPRPVPITYTAPDAFGFILTWPDAWVLQSAPTVTGAWEDVGGVSPYTVIFPTGRTTEFFRVTIP